MQGKTLCTFLFNLAPVSKTQPCGGYDWVGGIDDGDGEGEGNDDINNVSHRETNDMDCGVDNSGNGDEMIVMLMMEIVTVVLMVTMAMGCR